MKMYALVGDSGTGKSYNAIYIAAKYGLDYIIDDGLLICKNKIIEGTSAKKEPTLVAAVKKAIFQNDENCEAMKKAIQNQNPEGILILGTSIKMVEKIRTRLCLTEFKKILKIEDIATEDEISKAKFIRHTQGKHVIPVPVMEIRKTFSGYFLDPLQVFRRNAMQNASEDKSIVRPSYSYLGDFVIYDTVLYSLASYEATSCEGVDKVVRISLDKNENSVTFNLEVTMFYGTDIRKTSEKIVNAIKESVEKYAAIYTDGVNLTVRALTLTENS